MNACSILACGEATVCVFPIVGLPIVACESPGYKNTKYLTKVVFMPQRNGGYWSDKGYEWYGGT